MTTHRLGKLRRFQFNLPQRIAAGLLAIFLLQGLWLVSHQTMTSRDYQYARCGREMWEPATTLNNAYTSCGNIHDGVLAYRLAGLPLTFNLLIERGLDHFRAPENRVVQTEGTISTWELRHQMPYMLLLERLPFLLVGCVLGGALWWVTRRLYGNFGGYTALSFYCFSPAILKACVMPSAEMLATLGIYAGIYTCIGVAHAMQGPRRKWRPRIVLLTIIFTLAAASHIVALALAALIGLCFMLWVAESRRKLVFPVVGIALAGAFALLFVCYGFSPSAYVQAFSSSVWQFGLSFDSACRFFSSISNAGITVAVLAALLLFAVLGKARYFGNITPLLCTLALFLLLAKYILAVPLLWAMPFLLTFVGGVFADIYETPRGKFAMYAVGALVLLQAVLCLIALPGAM